jgi:phosphatidylglycerophosphatase C
LAGYSTTLDPEQQGRTFGGSALAGPKRPTIAEWEMVMTDDERQMRNSARLSGAGPIVAFDFDGTITVSDSFRGFLRWRSGAGAYALGFLRLIPAALAYLVDRDRGRLKAAMVRIYLRGTPREALQRQADDYAAFAAPRLLRPDALKEWRRRQDAGCRMVIVTASPDLLVWPFARALGADLLLGTRLTFDAQDRVAGTLTGANCRGPEKVRRLREAFGEDMELLAAYGDTAGDREMLAHAREGFMRLFVETPAPAG